MLASGQTEFINVQQFKEELLYATLVMERSPGSMLPPAAKKRNNFIIKILLSYLTVGINIIIDYILLYNMLLVMNLL